MDLSAFAHNKTTRAGKNTHLRVTVREGKWENNAKLVVERVVDCEDDEKSAFARRVESDEAYCWKKMPAR